MAADTAMTHDVTEPADGITAWLMEGDPAIRWQTLRDLRGAPPEQWQAERRRTLSEGWGARLLALQGGDGRWGGGIYSPKWTSSTYTLLTLCDIGIPADCAAAKRGAELVLAAMLGETCGTEFDRRLARCDRCVVGMILRLAAYFRIDDPRVEALVANLLQERMPDGGWNCRRSSVPPPTHSSFHTTFNVLEGLREYVEAQGAETSPVCREVLRAEGDALELLLRHRLYRSDRTGRVIDDKFTMLSYPPRWRYDVLRGLEYFAHAGVACDPRLQDAIDLLCGKRRRDGLWPVQNKHAGRVFFDMEATGRASRWNTLRALRVLRWWTAERSGVS